MLLTFALIVLFEEGRSLLVGNDFLRANPCALDFPSHHRGFSYSAYRFAVMASAFCSHS